MSSHLLNNPTPSILLYLFYPLCTYLSFYSLNSYPFIFSFFFSFTFISWRLITLQYCSGFCHTLTWISHGFTCVPSWSLLPPASPSHPSGSSQCTSPEHLSHASILGWSNRSPGLVICFTLDSILVSMLFSQNIPPSPSPTESKSLFCTSVCASFSVLHIVLYHYHLLKFHIYVLVYCIGLYPSGLLHSV